MTIESAPENVPPSSAALQPNPLLPTSLARKVFVGRFGLRAGWGIAIYLLLAALIAFAITIGVLGAKGELHAFFHGDQSTNPKTSSSLHSNKEIIQALKPVPTIINDGLAFAVLALVSWILARIERRSFGTYGVGVCRGRDFLSGAAWGLVVLSLLVAILASCHALVFEHRALALPETFLWGTKWLVAFLAVGLTEEYLSRGYLQYTLSRGFLGLAEWVSARRARALSFWLAAVLMSVLFSLGHTVNSGETRLGVISAFMAGMTFSYALYRTGSLWWAIGFHMAWDWSQTFLYGVPDSGYIGIGRLFVTHPAGNPILSGGTAGPEGSVLIIPTLFLVVLIIRFTKNGAQTAFAPYQKCVTDPRPLRP